MRPETITRSAEATHTHTKVLDRGGEFAKVTLRLEPLPRGGGLEFVNAALPIALHAPRDQAPPADLIPLDVWFRALEAAASQNGGTFATCAGLARCLLDDPREPAILHGDIHHSNVLDGGERGWLAIDPKGLIGERAFEYANLFRNPDFIAAVAPGRIRRLAEVVADEASLDPRRLLKWVIAYAGLGAAWSMEGGGDPQPGLVFAEQAVAVAETV